MFLKTLEHIQCIPKCRMWNNSRVTKYLLHGNCSQVITMSVSECTGSVQRLIGEQGKEQDNSTTGQLPVPSSPSKSECRNLGRLAARLINHGIPHMTFYTISCVYPWITRYCARLLRLIGWVCIIRNTTENILCRRSFPASWMTCGQLSGWKSKVRDLLFVSPSAHALHL